MAVLNIQYMVFFCIETPSQDVNVTRKKKKKRPEMIRSHSPHFFESCFEQSSVVWTKLLSIRNINQSLSDTEYHPVFSEESEELKTPPLCCVALLYAHSREEE